MQHRSAVFFERPARRKRKRAQPEEQVARKSNSCGEYARWVLLTIMLIQSINNSIAMKNSSNIDVSLYGNSSAIMSQQQVVMTNTSLASSGSNDKSQTETSQQQQASIKGRFLSTGGTANSPAHNSRQQFKNRQQQDMMQLNESSSRASGGDLNETQTFVTINSVQTSIGVEPKMSQAAKMDALSTTGKPHMKSANSDHQLVSLGSSKNSNVQSKSPTGGPGSQPAAVSKTSVNQGRPEKVTPKFLQHPYMDPVIVGTQGQRVHLMSGGQSKLPDHPDGLDNSPNPFNSISPVQVEKPTSGYSYDLPAYTHTSPLSPARHEVLMAEQLRQRQRQKQVAASYNFYRDRDGLASLNRSPPMEPQQRSMSQQLEQMASSSAGKLSISSPNFNQQQQQLLVDSPNQNYHRSNQAQSTPKSPVAAHHHLHQNQHQGGLAMIPNSLHTVTGTATNPCKPAVPGLNLDQQQQQQLLVQANEIAQAIPNFSSSVVKYSRIRDGLRLRSGFIFKVIRADSLTDCEAACTRASAMANNNPSDTCRSFNYRPYFAAENCELSRHDSRQLKFEDAAQFEQHTQFDFYALEPAPMQSSPLMASASADSYLSSSLLMEPAECLDVSQSCSQDGMEFSLKTNEPFNGRIYTYGFYDSCFADGINSLNTVLRISKSNGFPRCGTQQIGDLMTNIVVVQFNDYVQTTRDKKYNLTCYFSGPGEAVVTSNYLDTKIDERSHPIQIEHLPPQNVITSNVHLRVLYRGQPTNTIAVGDLLTFRLETRAPGTGQTVGRALGGGEPGAQNEIFATNVLAKDPYSGREVQLIDSRGCPIDPVNVFPELQRTPDGALEAEFYAFKIPDSNFLIFQATVRTCKSPCEPVICQTNQPQQQSSKLYQSAASIKGGLGGYLMGPAAQLISVPGGHHQHNQAPSWGKKRRRRWSSSENSELAGDEIGLGESVEHVIPIKSGQSGPNFKQVVTTYRRPELSEAEEEVKEMFRVYLSRAEMNSNKQRAKQPAESLPLVAISTRLVDSVHPAQATNLPEVQRQQQHVLSTQAPDLICLNHLNYYILVFTIISLTMIMLSISAISFYILSRRKQTAKFNIITESLRSSSMF